MVLVGMFEGKGNTCGFNGFERGKGGSEGEFLSGFSDIVLGTSHHGMDILLR